MYAGISSGFNGSISRVGMLSIPAWLIFFEETVDFLKSSTFLAHFWLFPWFSWLSAFGTFWHHFLEHLTFLEIIFGTFFFALRTALLPDYLLALGALGIVGTWHLALLGT